MQEKLAENPPKNEEKQPFQGVPPLYVVGILLQVWCEKSEPLTISQIRDKIYQQSTFLCSRNAIVKALQGLTVCCPNLILHTETVHAGDSRARAFSITFKTENHGG